MRKLVSTAAVTALVGLGLSVPATTATVAAAPPAALAAAPAAATSYTPPPIRWGRCSSEGLREAGARCGFVTVPLDYAKPRGTKIRLAVSRIKHTTARSQGPMLVNPGGPGASGLEYARLGGSLPQNAGAGYDWIGFDPRGVGSSRPSLRCDSDYFKGGRKAYVPTSDTIEQYWLTRTRKYARACAKAGGALLKHTRTVDWAKDVDSIRKALGAKRINFYGFSYGTYLAQVYATLFPQRVRRFVLDGVVNPTDVWYDANLEQDKQFDKNIDTFFRWVAKNDAVYGLGTDGDAVRAIYYDVLADLTAHPRPGFGAAEWNDVFVGAGYYVYGWSETANILVAAADGRLAPAKAAYGDPTGPGSDNTYAVYLAVQCTDAPWPKRWSTWEQDNAALHETAPFLTWNNAWYNAPCRTWSAPAHRPVVVKGKNVPGMLLIAETNDAATPFAGALEVRKRFKRSVLIEGVGGTTHSGSLSGVACTDNRIARYLLTGRLPKRVSGNRSDVHCAPVPRPTATAAGAGDRRSASPQDRLGPLRALATDASARR